MYAPRALWATYCSFSVSDFLTLFLGLVVLTGLEKICKGRKIDVIHELSRSRYKRES